MTPFVAFPQRRGRLG